MATNLILFPAAGPHHPSHLAKLPVCQPARQLARPSAPNRFGRIHLCDQVPCEAESFHRSPNHNPDRSPERSPNHNSDHSPQRSSPRHPRQRAGGPLDLAAQVGLTVSRVDRHIAESAARELKRPFYDPDDTPDIPA